MKVKITITLLLLFIALAPAYSQKFMDYINPALTINMMYFADNNGKQGVDPDPVTPAIGFSVWVNAIKNLRLELTGDVYQKYYEWNSTIDNPDLFYPMTASRENRSTYVVGIKPGISVTGYLPLGEKGFGGRLFAGPAADLRITLLPKNLHPDDFTDDENDAQWHKDNVKDYFWSKGRWFYPFAGIGFDFPVHPKLMLALDLRTWFPMYRIWTDKDLPKIDGWRFGVGIRLSPRKDFDYYIINPSGRGGRASRDSVIKYEDDYNEQPAQQTETEDEESAAD